MSDFPVSVEQATEAQDDLLWLLRNRLGNDRTPHVEGRPHVSFHPSGRIHFTHDKHVYRVHLELEHVHTIPAIEETDDPE